MSDTPLILSSCAGAFAVAGFCVSSRHRPRMAAPMTWMATASALAALAALIRHLAPDRIAVLLAPSAALMALGCVWAACRSLEARPFAPPWLLAPPLLWVAACLLPAVAEDAVLQLRLAALASAGLGVGALMALLGTGRSRPAGRAWILALLGLHVLANLVRGLAPALPGDEGATDEWTLFAVTALSLAMTALLRDERRALGLGRAPRRCDAATGLGNRRAFEAALAGAFGRASRAGAELALVLVEVGPAGDPPGSRAAEARLRALARTIRATLYRPADLAFRYGDAEFALLLPGTDAKAACLVAERIRQGAAAGRPGEAGVDTAVATMRPTPEDVPYDLLRRADRAWSRDAPGGNAAPEPARR